MPLQSSILSHRPQWVAALTVLCFSFASAVAQTSAAPKLEFEIVSVKPTSADTQNGRFMMQPGGKLSISNMTLKSLIQIAYQVREFQVTGGPAWIGSDHFDIEAKTGEEGPPPDFRSMTEDQREESQKKLNQRVKALLSDRFQVVVHEEQKEMPVYALVVAKSGSKLKPPSDSGGMRGIRMQRGVMQGTAAPIKNLTDVLASAVGRPVVDKTGLDGMFDWKLEWTPDQPTPNSPGAIGEKPNAPAPSDISGPSIFSALQEQLGLRLESQKAPALLIVVESAAKPSAN